MMKQQNETVEREAAVSLDQASIDGAVEAKAAKTAKASEAARVKKASQATRATSTQSAQHVSDAQYVGASSSIVSKRKKDLSLFAKKFTRPKTPIRLMKSRQTLNKAGGKEISS